MAGPLRDNSCRDPAAVSFLPKGINKISDFFLRQVIDQIKSSYLGILIHAHIKRAVELEAKTAFRRYQLHIGNTKIKNNAVHGVNFQVTQHVRDILKIISDERKRTLMLRKTQAGSAQGIIILIYADEMTAWRNLSQYAFTMPPFPQSTINNHHPWQKSQVRQNLTIHHRGVSAHFLFFSPNP